MVETLESKLSATEQEAGNFLKMSLLGHPQMASVVGRLRREEPLFDLEIEQSQSAGEVLDFFADRVTAVEAGKIGNLLDAWTREIRERGSSRHPRGIIIFKAYAGSIFGSIEVGFDK
ncbi:MAG: hypothetical protein NUV69_00985 [Candidatus Curtissbacteria bacterium]|nr:hypothetical protein [Candidatus Curtissbacteria bacterium]